MYRTKQTVSSRYQTFSQKTIYYVIEQYYFSYSLGVLATPSCQLYLDFHPVIDPGQGEYNNAVFDCVKIPTHRNKKEYLSALRIRDVYPGSDFFPLGSRIRTFPYRIRIKEFKYFNPKWLLSSRKYDPGCSSWIPDPRSGSILFTQPGSWIQGSKRHPDPDPQH